MSMNVVGRVMDVSRRLRHKTVEHTQQVLGDTLFVGQDSKGAGCVLKEQGADAVPHGGSHCRDVPRDMANALDSTSRSAYPVR